jgi:tetratricopeptide (TPR) repeat protein
MNALFTPGFGYNFGLGYSMLGALPTWNAWNFSSWGLGSLSNPWLYAGYVNPYLAPQTQTIIVQQPVAVPAGAPDAPQQVVAYDYSQPIDVAAAPPDPSVTDTAQQVFAAARDSFKAGDYPRALALSDQALVQLPNDPVLHEFRALCLFALKRFDEAAQVVYTVLSAGPGWDWTTLTGLYPSVETYTDQVRALEGWIREHVDDAGAHFLLAYHYMVQGHTEAAAARFQVVAQLEPKDQLSARLARVLAPAQPAPALGQPGQPAQVAQAPPSPSQPAPAQVAQSPPGPSQPAPESGAGVATATTEEQPAPPPPPPPPADLVGTWKAQPGPGMAITLTLGADGAFTWAVAEKGKTQSLQGQAGFQDGVLALNQEDGPPLVGKITREGANTFSFKPAGASASVKGLEFTR